MFEYRESRDISPAAAFFILIGMIGAGLLIGSFLALAVWVPMTGRGILTMEKDMMDPKFADATRLVQMVSVFATLFLPAVFGALVVNRKPFKWLGFKQPINISQTGLVIITIFACIPLVGALAELNEQIPISKSLEATFRSMEDKYKGAVESLARINSFGDYLFSLVVLALLPALFEEALFRGAMQQILQRWFRSAFWAILVTSIIFSAIHMSYYGFLPRFALGVVLGLLFYYSRSLWPSAIAHFVNNAVSVTYMYYMSIQGKPVTEDALDTAPMWIGLPSIAVVAVLLIIFKRVSANKLASSSPATMAGYTDEPISSYPENEVHGS